MGVARGLAFAVLVVASGFIALVHPVIVLRVNRTRVLAGEDWHVSGIPVIGSCLGWLAVLVCPGGALRDRGP